MPTITRVMTASPSRVETRACQELKSRPLRTTKPQDGPCGLGLVDGVFLGDFVGHFRCIGSMVLHVRLLAGLRRRAGTWRHGFVAVLFFLLDFLVVGDVAWIGHRGLEKWMSRILEPPWGAPGRTTGPLSAGRD